MKEIRLTQGQVAIVDADDFERVNALKWYAHWIKTNKAWYAQRKEWTPEGQRTVFLHRFIMGDPLGFLVDHLDGNTLDCRKNNLRQATKGQNCRNRGKQSNNTSGYKGVSRFPESMRLRKPWLTHIEVGGKRINVGTFSDPLEAAYAYDRSAREHFGEFARLNFPEVNEVSAAYVHPKPRTPSGIKREDLVRVDIGGMTQLVTANHPLARS